MCERSDASLSFASACLYFLLFYFVFLAYILNKQSIDSIACPNRAPLADGIDGASKILVVVHVFLLVDEEVICLLVAESFRIVQA